MLRKAKGQAAVSVIVPKFGDRENDGARGGGLNVKNSRASAPCAIVRCRRIRSQERLQAWRLAFLEADNRHASRFDVWRFFLRFP